MDKGKRKNGTKLKKERRKKKRMERKGLCVLGN